VSFRNISRIFEFLKNKLEVLALSGIFHTEKRNHFEGVLYQYFEGIYHERERGEREKKIIQTFRESVVIEKRNFY
jgi:hypothetical protein